MWTGSARGSESCSIRVVRPARWSESRGATRRDAAGAGFSLSTVSRPGFPCGDPARCGLLSAEQKPCVWDYVFLHSSSSSPASTSASASTSCRPCGSQRLGRVWKTKESTRPGWALLSPACPWYRRCVDCPIELEGPPWLQCWGAGYRIERPSLAWTRRKGWNIYYIARCIICEIPCNIPSTQPGWSAGGKNLEAAREERRDEFYKQSLSPVPFTGSAMLPSSWELLPRWWWWLDD